jgi:phosphatidylglycerophosphate synthase
MKMNVFPHYLSMLRLLMAPLVFNAIYKSEFGFATFLIVLAVFTDILDGVIARNLGTESPFGSYIDVIADFSFLFATCAALVFVQVYSYGLLLVMLAMFLQFVLLPKSGRLIYDPVGKYFGSVLYGMVLVTLTLPDFALIQAFYLIVLCLSFASLLSRIFLTLPFSKRQVPS